MERTKKRRRRTRSSSNSNSIGSQDANSSKDMMECQADASVSSCTSQGNTSSLQGKSTRPLDLLGFNEDGTIAKLTSGRESPVLLQEFKHLSDNLHDYLYANRKAVYEVLRESSFYSNSMTSGNNSANTNSDQKSLSSDSTRKRSHDSKSPKNNEKSESDTSSDICEGVTDPVFSPQTKKKKHNNKNLDKSHKNGELCKNQDSSSQEENITTVQASSREKRRSLERSSTVTSSCSKNENSTTPDKATPDFQGEEIFRWDKYCWVCHKKVGTMKELKELMAEQEKRMLGDCTYDNKKTQQILFCQYCVRSYHLTCADIDEPGNEDASWICNDCKNIYLRVAHSKTLQKSEPVSKDLRTLLVCVLTSMTNYKNAGLFHFPVSNEEYPAYKYHIIKPMDLQTLLRKADSGAYQSKSEFVSDVEWIVHNSIIFNKSSSPVTSSARSLLRVCNKELEEASICLDCYIHAHRLKTNAFVQVCRIPHILLWAKLKGYPYWPAKLMKIVNDEALVRFFGQHDRAYIPVRNCYLFSKDTPNMSVVKNNDDYDSSLKEIQVHINRLKKEYKEFKYAPFKTVLEANLTKQQRLLQLPKYNMKKALQTRVLYKKMDYEEILKKGETHEPLVVHWNWRSAKGKGKCKAAKTDSSDSRNPAPHEDITKKTKDQLIRLRKEEMKNKERKKENVNEENKQNDILEETLNDKRAQTGKKKGDRKKSSVRKRKAIVFSEENNVQEEILTDINCDSVYLLESSTKIENEDVENKSQIVETSNNNTESLISSPVKKDRETDRVFLPKVKKTLLRKLPPIAQRLDRKLHVVKSNQSEDEEEICTAEHPSVFVQELNKISTSVCESSIVETNDVNNKEQEIADTSDSAVTAILSEESDVCYNNSNGVIANENILTKSAKEIVDLNTQLISEVSVLPADKSPEKQIVVDDEPNLMAVQNKQDGVEIELDTDEVDTNKIVNLESNVNTCSEIISEFIEKVLNAEESSTAVNLENINKDNCILSESKNKTSTVSQEKVIEHNVEFSNKIVDSSTEITIDKLQEDSESAFDKMTKVNNKNVTEINEESDKELEETLANEGTFESCKATANSIDKIDKSLDETKSENNTETEIRESLNKADNKVTHESSELPGIEKEPAAEDKIADEYSVKSLDNTDNKAADDCNEKLLGEAVIETANNHQEKSKHNNNEAIDEHSDYITETRSSSGKTYNDNLDESAEISKLTETQQHSVEICNSVNRGSLHCSDRHRTQSGQNLITPVFLEYRNETGKIEDDMYDNKRNDVQNSDVATNKNSCVETVPSLVDEFQKKINVLSVDQNRPSVISGNKIVNDEKDVVHHNELTNHDLHVDSEIPSSEINRNAVSFLDDSNISQIVNISSRDETSSHELANNNDSVPFTLPDFMKTNLDTAVLEDIFDQVAVNAVNDFIQQSILLAKTPVEEQENTIKESKTSDQSSCHQFNESIEIHPSDGTKNMKNVTEVNVSSLTDSFIMDFEKLNNDSCTKNSIDNAKPNDGNIKCENTFDYDASDSIGIQSRNIGAQVDTVASSEISELLNSSRSSVTENIVENNSTLQSVSEPSSENDIDNYSTSGFEEGTRSVSSIEEDVIHAINGINACSNKRRHSTSCDNSQFSDSTSENNITDEDSDIETSPDSDITKKQKKKKKKRHMSPDKKTEFFPNVLEPQITLSVSPTNTVTLTPSSQQDTIVKKEILSGASVYLSKEVSLTVISDKSAPNTDTSTKNLTTDSINNICNIINSSHEVTISPVFTQSSPTLSTSSNSNSSTDSRNGNTPSRQRRKSATPKRHEDYTTVDHADVVTPKTEIISGEEEINASAHDNIGRLAELTANLCRTFDVTVASRTDQHSSISQPYTHKTSFSTDGNVAVPALLDLMFQSVTNCFKNTLEKVLQQKLPTDYLDGIIRDIHQCEEEVMREIHSTVTGVFKSLKNAVVDKKKKKKKHPCTYCYGDAQFKCCDSGFYCNYSCQKQSWSNHQKECTHPDNITCKAVTPIDNTPHLSPSFPVVSDNNQSVTNDDIQLHCMTDEHGDSINLTCSWNETKESETVKKRKRLKGTGTSKRKRCGECSGCQILNNCGKCPPCLNPKTHQICKQRRCLNLLQNPVNRAIQTSQVKAPKLRFMEETLEVSLDDSSITGYASSLPGTSWTSTPTAINSPQSRSESTLQSLLTECNNAFKDIHIENINEITNKYHIKSESDLSGSSTPTSVSSSVSHETKHPIILKQPNYSINLRNFSTMSHNNNLTNSLVNKSLPITKQSSDTATVTHNSLNTSVTSNTWSMIPVTANCMLPITIKEPPAINNTSIVIPQFNVSNQSSTTYAVSSTLSSPVLQSYLLAPSHVNPNVAPFQIQEPAHLLQTNVFSMPNN